MADKTVYRSTHPDVLKIWDVADTATRDWHAQVEMFLAEHDLAGRKVYFSSASSTVLGVEHVDGEEVPCGWRVHRSQGYLVPRLTTKEGKLLNARLTELKRPDPRDQVPGMPKNCLADASFLTCGMQFMGGALYVTWSKPIPEKQVDSTIWERVKLSEYYAAVEAAEEVAGRG
ncbi:hypothetical protein ABT340_41345 [Streptosporangium sp. NPDC000239]|uniref:hypothetical protein n=1 Tax=Streptosporangium sp. NPDC000239 TaxID=3154248 RepID=UPI003321F5BD